MATAAAFATALLAATSCSYVQRNHDTSLWEWYRTTDLDAERAHLRTLRRLTRGESPPAGLRLERAFHERRVGDADRVVELLDAECVEHPAAALLIERLAGRWGVDLPEDEPDAPAAGDGDRVREQLMLVLPTIDGRSPAARAAATTPEDALPVEAFDAAAWTGARGTGRYPVPVQISLEVLDEIDLPVEFLTVEALPARSLYEGWGIGSAVFSRVDRWERVSPYTIEYDVTGLHVVFDRPADEAPEADPVAERAPRIVAQETMSSTASAEPRHVFAGPFLEDNPLGAENVERTRVEAEARPIDASELALGLQRQLITSVARRGI